MYYVNVSITVTCSAESSYHNEEIIHIPTILEMLTIDKLNYTTQVYN